MNARAMALVEAANTEGERRDLRQRSLALADALATVGEVVPDGGASAAAREVAALLRQAGGESVVCGFAAGGTLFGLDVTQAQLISTGCIVAGLFLIWRRTA